ncbi:MAG: VWA domain-containing protein [Muribaculaceae bacterium]|nr:VWA domain-containing protein [Muribaculaceae bacterium]
METVKKTKIHNIIILDKSGSMGSIARQAIDGVNETIASIKMAQEKNPEQDNDLSLVAFCGCEMRVIYRMVPILKVEPMTRRDYRPCCMTPLYDAIGYTITEAHRIMQSEENVMASVTIITDGYENASREYSHSAISSLIEAYKSEGWLFAYIGADHDVEKVARSLNIDNDLRFEKTSAGTKRMFTKYNVSRERYLESVMPCMSSKELSQEDKERILKENAKGFFKD